MYQGLALGTWLASQALDHARRLLPLLRSAFPRAYQQGGYREAAVEARQESARPRRSGRRLGFSDEVEHRFRTKLNTDSGMLNTDFGHRERSSVA